MTERREEIIANLSDQQKKRKRMEETAAKKEEIVAGNDISTYIFRFCGNLIQESHFLFL